METILQETQILTTTYEEVRRRFSGLDDLAHGWEHVQRVYHLALWLAEEERADRFVVGMAALMHDLGRATPHDPTHHMPRHHADLSVELARRSEERRVGKEC